MGLGLGLGVGGMGSALLLLGVEVHRRTDSHALLGEQQQQQHLVRVRAGVRGKGLGFRV